MPTKNSMPKNDPRYAPKTTKKDTRYVSTLYVRASGAQSLIDMMRYDDCYPASEQESSKIVRLMSHDAKPSDRIVRLTRVARTPGDPTYGRWASYNCRVVAVRHPDDSPLSDAELLELGNTRQPSRVAGS